MCDDAIAIFCLVNQSTLFTILPTYAYLHVCSSYLFHILFHKLIHHTLFTIAALEAFRKKLTN